MYVLVVVMAFFKDINNIFLFCARLSRYFEARGFVFGVRAPIDGNEPAKPFEIRSVRHMIRSTNAYELYQIPENEYFVC